MLWAVVKDSWFWSILFWGTGSMLNISFIFKGQTFWLCWADFHRIRLTSSVISEPKAMSFSAESEDSSLYYYCWTSFMLIINQFNNICYWKAPTIMLLHKHIYHPLPPFQLSVLSTAWNNKLPLPWASRKYRSPQCSEEPKDQLISSENHNGTTIFSAKLVSPRKSSSWRLVEKIFLFSSVIREQ